MILERDNDCIAAIATAPGSGGIAVIRASGPNCLKILSGLCPFLPEQPESHKVYYGRFIHPKTHQPVDEVLLTYFAEGKSFTGEETCEVSCHGGVFLTKQILDLILQSGARLAERGEFTYRAFMNGRIDLVQAESVLSLIESESEQSARLAMRQLGGETSVRLNKLEQDLTWVLAHLEANIDFAQEDIQIASGESLSLRLKQVSLEIKKMVSFYEVGKIFKEGLEVALVGPPNVGKSSLLNALLGEDRAIVMNTPGTTRDLVEGQRLIQGVRVNFVDTAGLRETEDLVEAKGIERSQKVMERADYVLCVEQATSSPEAVLNWLPKLEPKRMFLILNKWDLLSAEEEKAWADFTEQKLTSAGLVAPGRIFRSSCETALGLDEILSAIGSLADLDKVDASATLTNRRHFDLLQRIEKSVDEGLSLLSKDESPELLAFELQDSLQALMELLGKSFDDEVMDRVFNEFCLGK